MAVHPQCVSAWRTAAVHRYIWQGRWLRKCHRQEVQAAMLIAMHHLPPCMQPAVPKQASQALCPHLRRSNPALQECVAPAKVEGQVVACPQRHDGHRRLRVQLQGVDIDTGAISKARRSIQQNRRTQQQCRRLTSGQRQHNTTHPPAAPGSFSAATSPCHHHPPPGCAGSCIPSSIQTAWLPLQAMHGRGRSWSHP